MRNVKVAVVQGEVAPDLETGLERTRELTLEAAADGATLVVFPETWLPGYPVWLDVCRDVALWDHSPVKRVFALRSVTRPCSASTARPSIAEALQTTAPNRAAFSVAA